MKVIVTTTYENLDQKTVDLMIQKLSNEGWPKDQVNQIRSDDFGLVKSKDPDSEQAATTTFLVDKYSR